MNSSRTSRNELILGEKRFLQAEHTRKYVSIAKIFFRGKAAIYRRSSLQGKWLRSLIEKMSHAIA